MGISLSNASAVCRRDSAETMGILYTPAIARGGADSPSFLGERIKIVKVRHFEQRAEL